MAAPDRSTDLRLLDEGGLPAGIVVHSRGVARVAVAAAGLVAEASIPVDGALVEAAALLHDIDKAEIRSSGGEHGVVGARRLEAAGYEELAWDCCANPCEALHPGQRCHPAYDRWRCFYARPGFPASAGLRSGRVWRSIASSTAPSCTG